MNDMTTTPHPTPDALREALISGLHACSRDCISPGTTIGLDRILSALAPLVEELKRDKERLDWLEANKMDLAESNGNWYLAGSVNPKIQGVEYPTTRAAIDAAKEAK